jgi:hypothetical protein
LYGAVLGRSRPDGSVVVRDALAHFPPDYHDPQQPQERCLALFLIHYWKTTSSDISPDESNVNQQQVRAITAKVWVLCDVH